MPQDSSSQSRFADTRITLQLAWPIMVTQLAQIGSAFVDSTMAGHYSASALAAISIGSSIWIALMVTLLGLTLATGPLVAHRVGAGEHHAIPGIVQQGLWQGLAFAFAGVALAWLVAPLFPLSGLEATSADKAARFLRAASWGLPALALHRVLACYSASLNCTRPMMFIALFGLALNIPVNWVLIYGKFGFPELGGVGCGYATAFCMWVSTGLLAAWIRWAPPYQPTQPLRHWQTPDLALQHQLFKLGLPIGMLFLVEVSAFSMVALLIARLGNVPVAAHQIALNFTGIVFMIPSALGHALTVRVGHALGAGLPGHARQIGYDGILIGLGYALFSALLIGLGNHAITALYTTDTAVRELAAELLFYAAVFQLGDASQTTLAGILRGYKITKWPMLVYIGAFWLFGIPLGYLLAFGYRQGAGGFWQALVLALALAALLLYGLFVRESRRQLRI